jgi:cell division protein FtsI/penicillin-binding protein 2
MAVVMDPRTGDVLAIAIRPTFNPNAFLDVPGKDVWRNRAVTDPFEPGSTFKVILAAAALEEGVVRPDDRIWAENRPRSRSPGPPSTTGRSTAG